MNAFSLTVSTPDGSLFRGDAAGLYLRGACGDLAILAGHAPFMTPVKAGICKIVLPSGEEKKGRTEGGMLCVAAEGVTLLSGTFRFVEGDETEG